VEKLRLQSEGIIPFQKDIENKRFDSHVKYLPLLMGQAVGGIHDVKPAGAIVEQMVKETIEALKRTSSFAKL